MTWGFTIAAVEAQSDCSQVSWRRTERSQSRDRVSDYARKLALLCLCFAYTLKDDRCLATPEKKKLDALLCHDSIAAWSPQRVLLVPGPRTEPWSKSNAVPNAIDMSSRLNHKCKMKTITMQMISI